MLMEILSEAGNLQKPANPRKLARIGRTVDNGLFCRHGGLSRSILLGAAH
jgi:hypothetical protein